MAPGEILISFLLFLVMCFLFALLEQIIKEHRRSKKKQLSLKRIPTSYHNQACLKDVERCVLFYAWKSRDFSEQQVDYRSDQSTLRVTSKLP